MWIQQGSRDPSYLKIIPYSAHEKQYADVTNFHFDRKEHIKRVVAMIIHSPLQQPILYCIGYLTKPVLKAYLRDRSNQDSRGY